MYEDTQSITKAGENLYAYLYTKALVFVFPNRQIVFERDTWFSEDIVIYRGANVAAKIAPPEEELEESGECEFRVGRKVTSLASSLSNA